MTNGQSRASKKRARAKQKKSNNTPNTPATTLKAEDESVPFQHHVNENVELDESDVKKKGNTKKHKTTPASTTRKSTIEIENKESILSAIQEPIKSIGELIECSHDSNTNSNSSSISKLSINRRSELLFEYILQSSNKNKVTTQEFFDTYWEKKVLHIPASSSAVHKLDGLLDIAEIESMIEKQPLQYGIDLNVTNVIQDGTGGTRITLDPVTNAQNSKKKKTDKLVDCKKVWKQFNEESCSIRLLCPHKYNDKIHALLSTLEYTFGCMVGCNAYLTPSNNAQGFAPHYDDIDAFILQLAGSKHWKVYKNEEGVFPRESSNDFAVKDIEEDENIRLVFDGVLKQGDVLYMPRGFIHYAVTPPSSDDVHSLHLTVSTMQHWSWADYLELLMPTALDACIHDTPNPTASLRRNMPTNFLDYMGVMHDTNDDFDVATIAQPAHEDADEKDPKLERARQKRGAFHAQAKRHILKVCQQALTMLDNTSDEMAKRYLLERQPPSLFLSEQEKQPPHHNIALLPTTRIRLLRPGIARLVCENQKAVVYHCSDNDRTYHTNTDSTFAPLEFELDDAPAIEQILTTEGYIEIQDLIHETDDMEEKVDIVTALLKEDILDVHMDDEDESINTDELEDQQGGDLASEEQDEDDDVGF